MVRKTMIVTIFGLLALALVACGNVTAQVAQPTASAVQPSTDAAPQSGPPQTGESDNDTVQETQNDAEPVAAAPDTTETPRPAGWSEETHGDATAPNYAVVFPDDAVNRIDITIAPETWQAMQDDMTALYGEFASRGAMGARPAGGEPLPPQGGGQAPAPGQAPPPRPADPAGRGGFVGGTDDENPMWAEATVEFAGETWTHVGIRFKGNSSLRSSWSSGDLKLPFKLDFDEFEDQYPEIDDQRFYGFRQLTLASNFNDNSLLREKVTADIFRAAGVPAPETAFYHVYVDYGEGSTYLGLYTLVEVVDDTLIETSFESDDGNVYKPEGQGATFAAGTFDPAYFDKETNQDEADWSDVQALYDALHAGTRTTDPATWRSDLEAVFDVDGFLNWLAVNAVVQNWDTYGRMSHNYYLYNDPATGLLTWIPWDNNEALHAGKMGGALSLGLAEVTADWPLIRYLMDDEVYRRTYVSYVEETINGAFEPSKMAALYQELHDLIQPYVTSAEGELSDVAFEAALEDLIAHAYDRYAAAQAFVAGQQ